jgi:hypothetical protein
MPITSEPLIQEPRDRFLRVRISAQEHRDLTALARARGMTLAETVRRRLRDDDRKASGPPHRLDPRDNPFIQGPQG